MKLELNIGRLLTPARIGWVLCFRANFTILFDLIAKTALSLV